jgi:AcrR family transcriptional regulator
MTPLTLPTQPKQPRAHATRLRLLDAAVEELIEKGYVGMTTSGVARRAGVSRGAQQNYFPHKTTLVAQTIRHVAARYIEELREQVAAPARGRARVQMLLDIIFRQNSTPLFAAVVELSLAVRGEPELRDVIAEQERAIARALREATDAIFGEEVTSKPAFAQRWATVLSAVRGLALLKLMGHAPSAVDRQWTSSTRPELIALLSDLHVR